jgi:ankyrin repeat protein
MPNTIARSNRVTRLANQDDSKYSSKYIFQAILDSTRDEECVHTLAQYLKYDTSKMIQPNESIKNALNKQCSYILKGPFVSLANKDIVLKIIASLQTLDDKNHHEGDVLILLNPLSLAILKNYPSTMALLREHGANLNHLYDYTASTPEAVNYVGNQGYHPLLSSNNKDFNECMKEYFSSNCNILFTMVSLVDDLYQDQKDKDEILNIFNTLLQGGILIDSSLLKKDMMFDEAGMKPQFAQSQLNLNAVYNKDTSNRYENAINNNENTLLHLAVMNDKFSEEDLLEFMSKLLACDGVNINARNSGGNTPLHLAAERCDFEKIKLLLKYNAALNIKNKEGKIPLHMAMENVLAPGYDKAILQLLSDHRVLVDYQHPTLRSTLLMYVPMYKKEIVDKLMYLQADKFASDSSGVNFPERIVLSDNTPDFLHYLTDDEILKNKKNLFFYALIKNKKNAARALLQRMPQLINTTSNGRDALSAAIIDAKSFELTKMLIVEFDADIGFKTDTGDTLLHLAVTNRNLQILDLMLHQKIDVNQTNNQGDTALHLAVRSNSYAMVAKLLAHGACALQENNNQQSAYRMAAADSNTADLLPLICKDFKVRTSLSSDKRTLLDLTGCDLSRQILLEHYLWARDYAVEHNNSGLTKQLLKNLKTQLYTFILAQQAWAKESVAQLIDDKESSSEPALDKKNMLLFSSDINKRIAQFHMPCPNLELKPLNAPKPTLGNIA